VLALDFSNSQRDSAKRVTKLHLRMLKARHGPAITFPVEMSTATLRFREIEAG